MRRIPGRCLSARARAYVPPGATALQRIPSSLYRHATCLVAPTIAYLPVHVARQFHHTATQACHRISRVISRGNLARTSSIRDACRSTTNSSFARHVHNRATAVLPHVCDHGSRKTNRGGDVHGKTALKTGISERVEATEVVHNSGYVGQHVDPWTEALERMCNDLVWRRILGEIYS